MLREEIGPQDEVIIVGDGYTARWAAIFPNQDARFEYVEFPGGRAGNPGRDHGIALARRSHLMFVDDDDCYIPGAINRVVRPALAAAPRRTHIFGVGGLPMPGPPYEATTPGASFVVPNIPGKVGEWDTPNEPNPALEVEFTPRLEYKFIKTTLEHYPEGPVLHSEPIYLMRPWGQGYDIASKWLGDRPYIPNPLYHT